MPRRFVIEAVMMTIYGQLLSPSNTVQYYIPYSTIMELYEMKDHPEQVMPDPADDAHVKQKIAELIAYFEDSFNKKKLERALASVWRESPPLPINDLVSLIVVNAIDNAEYGDAVDPVETELILTSMRTQAPILTDQFEFMDKVIDGSIPVQMFDIEDFEYALEADHPQFF
ncbi:ADP-heptose synthase [Paenibacillus thalictri]|uniref:ADP-heptose synthase n=1 Tax=Paenibacillus thalictri TaxID=2527873 RepID=A0A4Q9DTW3_9BACL|nr:ADP-heptose synthase [Paenibacillus thalictri]TBL80403.1 ADP-heptose synthase [Paenibacillus thalictri]